MARKSCARDSVLITILLLLVVSFGPSSAHAATCSTCHGMPPVDGPARDSRTGATKGNHQTHLAPGANAQSCEICHVSAGFTTAHRDGVISLQPNVNTSPATGQYKVGVGAVIFKNQTSVPVLGSCSNINCHFESTTPQWGGAQFTYTNATSNDCNKCHGLPPAGSGVSNSGGAAGSHAKHDSYFSGAAQCRKCHPDHTAEANKFAHATSAGNRNLLVQLRGPNDVVGGTYSGPLNDYLPSQTNAFGSCSTSYCHSTGNTSVSAANLPAIYSGSVYATPTWGNGAIGCNGCHGRSRGDGMPDYVNAGAPGGSTTNSHDKHVTSSAIGCNECHTRTTKNDTSVRSVTLHVNGTPDVFFNLSGASKNGVYNGGKTCSATYCHGSAASIAWGGTTTCISCHGATFTTFSSSSKKGAHARHIETETLPTSFTSSGNGNLGTVSSYQFGCASCHNPASIGHAKGVANSGGGAALVYFGYSSAGMKGGYVPGALQAGTDNGFKWTAGTGCNTNYCHSNGQGGAGAVNVSWNTAKGTLGCTGCHGGDYKSIRPISTGYHTQHTNNRTGLGRNFGCVECHVKTVSGNAVIANKTKHVNKFKDYSGANAGRISNGTCSSVYCHSSGQQSPVYRTTVSWNTAGTTYDCKSCHGNDGGFATQFGEPNYANISSSKNSWNSHSAKHIKLNSDCATCHVNTVSAVFALISSASPKHIDRVRDVNFDTAKAGTGAAYDQVNKTCSNVKCHSNGQNTPAYAQPRWGGKAKCNGCHPNLSGAHARHTGGLLATVTLYNYTSNVSAGDDTVGGWGYKFGCATCHPLNVNQHINGFIEVEMNGAAGASSIRNKSTAAVVNGTLGNGNVTCTAVYCHSDGKNTASKTTPAWNASFPAAEDRCNQCHGNSPTTGAHQAHVVGIHYNDTFNGVSGKLGAGAAGSVSHGVASQATTLNCNICHSATVISANNDKNTVCATCHDGTKATLRGNSSIANLGKHVNGVVELQFQNIAIVTKAQLRPNSFNDYTAAGGFWNRNVNNYKNGATAFDTAKTALNTATMWSSGNCSNIACHMGRTVNWSTSLGCQDCHSKL